jgi:hypothetical protein
MDKYENAKLRLDAMARARTPSPQTENLQRDIEVLQAMLLLLKGAQDVRAMQPGLGSSYEESKQLVYTLIETKPKFTRAKVAAVADTVGQLVTSAVPTAISAAGQLVAKATGSETVGKVFEGVKQVHDVTDASISAVGTFVTTVPPMVTTVMSTTHSSLVQQCMTWWMSANAAANATTLANGYLNILSHITTVISVLVTGSKLDPLQALEDRYRGTCSCCGVAASIAQEWMKGAASSAAGLHPVMAVPLATYGALDKGGHYVAKKLAARKGKERHRDGYHSACALWGAAQPDPSGHEVFKYRFPHFLGKDGRCPVAMLILATLFGRGNLQEGAAKAVAAILSNQASAVEKIKGLIG